MNRAKIVIITSGSFTGKSLISLKAASKLYFSGVVTTDTIRNLLKVTNSHKEYLSTSTYLLSPQSLMKQQDEVSELIMKIIPIYEKRGEHIIFEGMHFNDKFLEWASGKEYCCICLNNLLPLSRKVILKSKTRSKLRIIDKISSKHSWGHVNEGNVYNTSYLKYGDRIKEINNSILDSCKKHRFKLIEFKEISNGIKETVDYISHFYGIVN